MFEEINTASLRNALNSCKNSLNVNTSKEIVNNLNNNENWFCDSKNNFIRSLDKLVNVNYINLERLIDNYLEAVGLIEEYQYIKENNKQYTARISTLKNKLFVEKTTIVANSNGEKTITIQKDETIQREINKLDNIIRENDTKCESIKNSILNIIK